MQNEQNNNNTIHNNDTTNDYATGARNRIPTEYSVNLDLDTNFIRLGPCSGGTMIKATIENAGEQTDTYTISPQNNWIITAPQKVTLNPGEIKNIAIFMTPPCDIEPMEYTKDITVESGNSKDTETITIDVLRVHGVELDTTHLYFKHRSGN